MHPDPETARTKSTGLTAPEDTMTTDQTPRWRVIGTDTESDSGIAPVCDKPQEHAAWDAKSFLDPQWYGVDKLEVYDCCPGPHLECWTPAAAKAVAAVLNQYAVEVCD